MAEHAYAAGAVGGDRRPITSTRSGRRRSSRARLVGALCAAAIVLGCFAALPASSSAATYHFCSGCQIYDERADTAWRTLTLSYVNYIGTGNRLLGASAMGYSYLYGTNTATHGFNGSCCKVAIVGNFSGYTYVTSNAHANY